MIAFDTLKAALRLQNEAGFDEHQARILVATFAEDFGEDLATRDGLAQTETTLRSDMKKMEATLRGEIEVLRADMEKMEVALRGEIEALRADMEKMEVALRSEIEALRAEMKKMEVALRSEIEALRAEIEALRSDIKKWKPPCAPI